MIVLNNINIRFNKDIINNGSMTINDGQITSIIGDSGSGKTTLLYLLGLLSSHDCSYQFDGHEINLKDDKECSFYRKNKIGYIFQDNNINDQLTVAENIANSAMIAGEEHDEGLIKSLLSDVEVNVNPQSYPLKLSVGERQRVAIACALAKNPFLLIADEPTSALDEKNADIVMNIFRKFVKQPDRKVVIATHSKEVFNQTDCIYKIQDGSIVLLSDKTILNENQNISKENQKLNTNVNHLDIIKTQIRYALKRTQKDKGRKRLALILLGITIAFTILSSVLGERFSENQAKIINEIAENEMLVINNTLPKWNMRKDFEYFLAFDESEVLNFSAISGVKSTYSLYEFPALGYTREEGSFGSSAITLYQDSEIVGQFSFSDEDDLSYTVLPYWDWQNLDKKIIDGNDKTQDGVYISNVFARAFDIQDVDGMTIRFDACVPIALFRSTLTSEGETYPFDLNISDRKVFEYPIAGILDASIVNRYTMGGDNVIFLHFDLMEEAYLDTIADQHMLEEERSWMPSAVILEVSDIELLEYIRKTLLSLNPNYLVIVPVQDIQAMIEVTQGARTWATGISISLLVIVLIFMFVIYLNQTDARKYEIAMLRANGFRKKEVVGILCIEALIDAFRVAAIAFLVAVIVKFAFSHLIYLPIFDFGGLNILVIFTVSFVSIFIPTILVLSKINRYNPDKLMRN